MIDSDSPIIVKINIIKCEYFVRAYPRSRKEVMSIEIEYFQDISNNSNKAFANYLMLSYFHVSHIYYCLNCKIANINISDYAIFLYLNV